MTTSGKPKWAHWNLYQLFVLLLEISMALSFLLQPKFRYVYSNNWISHFYLHSSVSRIAWNGYHSVFLTWTSVSSCIVIYPLLLPTSHTEIRSVAHTITQGKTLYVSYKGSISYLKNPLLRTNAVLLPKFWVPSFKCEYNWAFTEFCN